MGNYKKADGSVIVLAVGVRRSSQRLQDSPVKHLLYITCRYYMLNRPVTNYTFLYMYKVPCIYMFRSFACDPLIAFTSGCPLTTDNHFPLFKSSQYVGAVLRTGAIGLNKKPDSGR